MASWYLLEGIKSYEQGLYVSAIVNLKSAAHLNSDLVLAYKYLGLSYSNMYLWDQAVREYNKMLFFNPDNTGRQEILKNIDEWENKKEHSSAAARYSYYILKYRSAVWQEPHNFLNYLALAEIYECEGEYAKTKSFYEYLAREDSSKDIFKLYLAETFTLSGAFDEAKAIYLKILKNDPLNFDAIIGLNLILKKEYDKKLKDDPNDLSARIGLAKALKELKRYENAIEEYKKVIERDNLNIGVRAELAGSYTAIGEYENAISQHEFIYKLDPKETENLFMMAQLYEKMGKTSDARETYGKILAVDPENAKAKKKINDL